MNTENAVDVATLRRWMYSLLIVLALGMACGRIVSTQRVYEPAFHRDPARAGDRRPVWPATRPAPMATFSSNDRSRWATIRALVHDGTYVVAKREREASIVSGCLLFGKTEPMQLLTLAQTGYVFRTSNRPTLSPRELAEREAITRAGGHPPTLTQHGILFEDGWQTIDAVLNPDTLEYYSSKPPLLSTLLAGVYWLLHTVFGWSLIDHPATVVRAMLLLVNALPFAGYLWLLTRVAETWGKTDWGKLYIVAAGAFATIVTPFLITLNNHTLGTFCVMAAWYSTLEIWRHREDPALPESAYRNGLHFVSAGLFSSFAVTCELPALAFAAACFVLLGWRQPRLTLLLFVPCALLPVVGYFATNYAAVGMWKPAQAQFTGPWYQFEGSHWKILDKEFAKKGIDFARNVESRPIYAMHVLIGHHGLFSLTPIWLLAVGAMLAGCWRWRELGRQALARAPADPADGLPWFVQPLGLALTVVVTGFYLAGDDSANYGGFTNGLRWLMWLTPIWLTCLLPMADRLAASRCGRCLTGVLLGVSVFSASYQLWNPWRHPWIFDLLIELGWPGY